MVVLSQKMDFRWFNLRFLRAHIPRPFELIHARGRRRIRTLAFASCVRGYHVYKDRWIPVTNEKLACRREPGNVHVPYGVQHCALRGAIIKFYRLCYFSQSYYMLFRHKTYQHDPQFLFINLITIITH